MSRFTVAQRDALFAAILVNDVVDLAADLPTAIGIGYAAEQLHSGFAISRELWESGFDRAAMLALVAALSSDGARDPAVQRDFKHVRAKFKHLRFAFVLYGTQHRCPRAFKVVTTAMGGLQDAARAGRRVAARHHAALLRLLLSRLPLERLRREAADATLCDPAAFRAFTLAQIAQLRGLITPPTITGHRFHVARKIVSRQVSFHDDMRVLCPGGEHDRLSRYLATLNGLMGQHHDALVARKVAGTIDYARDAIPLPPDVRQRLTELVARYPL